MILLGLAAFVLLLVVVAVVVFPLVRPERRALPLGIGSSEELLARRDQVLDELRELEFDHRVGKVTDDDYRETRARLETEAARILQAIDAQIVALDAEIEREIQRLRENPNQCASCGATAAAGARFCPTCGQPLIVAVRR